MDILEIAKLVSPILVGFVSAYVASLIAYKKFKKENFWNERHDTYTKIIKAFEELLYWAEQERADHFCEPHINVVSDPENALREIRRYSEVGAIQLSEQFHKKLKEADTAIHRVYFEINEESMGDNDEQSQQEWRFTQAINIRDAINSNLPELLRLAQEGITEKNLTWWSTYFPTCSNWLLFSITFFKKLLRFAVW